MKTVNLETLIKELQNEVNKGNKTLSFKGTILVGCSVILTTENQH